MKTTTTSFRCDDGAETFTLIRRDYPDADLSPDFELCIEDAFCDSTLCGVKGRLRRAWHAFWNKPIYYNGLYTEDGEAIKKFFHECIALIDKDEPKPKPKQMKSGWLEAEDGDGAVCPHCGTDYCILVYETEDFIYCPHCGRRVIEGERLKNSGDYTI